MFLPIGHQRHVLEGFLVAMLLQIEIPPEILVNRNRASSGGCQKPPTSIAAVPSTLHECGEQRRKSPILDSRISEVSFVRRSYGREKRYPGEFVYRNAASILSRCGSRNGILWPHLWRTRTEPPPRS